MKILFTGGGSGGHIFPIIAIIRELKKQNKKTEQEKRINPLNLYFVGPKSEIGLQLLKNEGVIVKTIFAGKIRRYITPKSILENIIDILFKIPISFIQASLYLRKIKPDIVFGKGGYGSFPVIWSAEKLKIPFFLHESDIVPGRVTKIFAKSTIKIFTSFEQTKIENISSSKIFFTGNPIRQTILNGSREKAKKIFELKDKKPIILILGGSQGAERINNIILQMLPQLLENFEIIHQCGKKRLNEILSTARIIIKKENLIKNYHPINFLNEEELKHAYAMSHLIISRAGSGSIFNIATIGKPSILIPLPEASQNHQAKNAHAFASNGAAMVMESKNPTPRLLYSNIMLIFSEPGKLKKMSNAALAFSKPNAAEIIATYLIKSK
jgi:UDP-N-acetylglucosamine--N-acetylmuramyl-(pentapeptide) pyrophosphoryl-undecaprenol N-acetylglucosamine transferase